MADEKQILIAAKLYEARAAVRLLLGGEYQAKMKPGIDALNRLCAANKSSPLSEAVRLASSLNREGREAAALLVLAAAVEMCETTKGSA